MPGSRLLKYARLDPGDLRNNKRHQFAASHALKIYGSGAIYTFIPKNACSTMRLSLAIANGCITGAPDIEWIHHNNETFRTDLEGLVRASYTFVILRDPFARLASCFLDKIVSQARPAKQLSELSRLDIDLDGLTFDGFVNLLENETVRKGNIHWRPQADFLVYEQYDDYLAMEDFAAAAISIERRAGMHVVDARPFTAHGLDRYRLLSAEDDHSRTPASEIALLKQNGVCPDPRSLYTRQLVDHVARLYADDLRLYADRIGLLTLFSGLAVVPACPIGSLAAPDDRPPSRDRP